MCYKICLNIVILINLCVHTSFADDVLSWKDCLSEASKNHPDLIAAAEQIQQSRNTQSITFSQKLPQFSADGKMAISNTKGAGSAKSYSYGLHGTQLIFDGSNSTNLVRAAKENVYVSRESFRYVSAQIRWRLRTAFINVLKSQYLIQLSEDILKIRQQNMQLINLRYQSGMEHRGALLTSQANVAQAELEINGAKRSLQLAQQELTKEMGWDNFYPVRVQGDYLVDIKINQMPDFKVMADKHPAYLKAVAQKNAAGFDINSSRAEFIPKISLSGDVGKSGDSWPADQSSSGASLNISLPVFEGGARLAQLSRSKSIYRQLQAIEQSSKEGIIVSLHESWNSLADAVENIDVQQKFMLAAEERSKISEAQYSVGTISFDNWTIIQDDLVRQKKSLLDAQTNALVAQANWVLAQGETLEYEE